MNKMSQGARVRELREAADLTQTALAQRMAGPDADELRVKSLTRIVQDIERGQSWPTWVVACALAKALEVKLDALAKEPKEVDPPKRGRRKKRGQSRVREIR